MQDPHEATVWFGREVNRICTGIAHRGDVTECVTGSVTVSLAEVECWRLEKETFREILEFRLPIQLIEEPHPEAVVPPERRRNILRDKD